jgi:16S rRNA processing protein RimM
LNKTLYDNLLIAGKIQRPHGLRGLLRIHAYAGSDELFVEAGTVFLKNTSEDKLKEFEIVSLIRQKKNCLLKLKGINHRDEAETYQGTDIFIHKDAIVRDEDEYFWHELLGLEVYLESGTSLGRINNIISAKGNDVYVVKKDKRELYLPATHEVIKQVDLEKNKMIISPLEGLLDLNEV